MKTKTTLLTLLLSCYINNTTGQTTIQTFANAGFKIECGCKLEQNSLFMQMAKQQEITNVFAAYVCAQNKNSPETGIITNINIYDESKNYKTTPSALFEKTYLAQYAADLKNAEINYTYTIYLGVTAIEYNFYQGDFPTKAIVFIKHKKMYLLQVGTRKDLQKHYALIKSTFTIL